MVKKKGKSKRVTLKDKYKMEKRVIETNRKRRKQTKKDEKAGVVKNKSKDPGIPNSWPFKQDLLKDIQRQRERQQQMQQDQKDKRKEGLRELKDHQAGGGSARTVEELMKNATKLRQEFDAKQDSADVAGAERQNNRNDPGQNSRRAYLRELKKVVDSADVLLQVLDARDPMGSRIAPSVENAILARADKKMVLVLNKIDLVPKEVVSDWLTVLRRSHPAIAVKASKDYGQGDVDATATTPVGMEGLLQLLKNYSRLSGSKSKTTIVVGIIGYPNTGKSSIINALKRTRAVGVSSRPGFTTSMQEVVLDKNVRLLDSPGVVFDDRSAMLGNCVNPDSIEDPIPAVSALIQRCNPASLVMTYNIPAFPPGNVMMFLAMVARAYGRVLKGGIPDKVGAARAVLRDWNSGKIPYYTPAPNVTVEAEDAVIVKSFGTEFDVTKYDEEIMKSLKDSDEMDFVQLTAKAKGDDDDDEAAAKFLEDGEEDDEMEEDEDDAQHVARQALAAGEDYDFDEL
jgi:nuclear GTP-binding protein